MLLINNIYCTIFLDCNVEIGEVGAGGEQKQEVKKPEVKREEKKEEVKKEERKEKKEKASPLGEGVSIII